MVTQLAAECLRIIAIDHIRVLGGQILAVVRAASRVFVAVPRCSGASWNQASLAIAKRLLVPSFQLTEGQPLNNRDEDRNAENHRP